MPLCATRYSYLDFVRYAFTAVMVSNYQDRSTLFAGVPVLEFYGVDGQNAWANLGYEVCFFAVFTALAYLALRFVRHDKR
jgi:ATP-binding cassette, subfamily G (WHITE), member 2